MTASTSGRRESISARSFLVGLAVSGSLVNLGCSQFRSRRENANKPVATLGSEMSNRDIYAKNAIKPPEPPVTTLVSDEGAWDPSMPGSFTPSSGAATADSRVSNQPIVKLQPPVTLGSAKSSGMPSDPEVPDRARLVAGAKRREQALIEAKPPAVKETTRVVSEARAALNQMMSYQLSLKRQERVNDVLLPAEDLVMSVRRAPKAVRLTWLDGPHRGREVLYRSDEPGGLMHVNMADSKFPLPRLSIAPDSPMVMKNSRHPITEAGLDPLVASMEQADQTGGLIDLGMQTPTPLTSPQHGVLQKTPVGNVWRAFFDPVNHLPSIVECRAGNGDLLESYLFQNIQPNVTELASSDAFDPNTRWGPPRGLFGRASARASDNTPTTR